jgi:glucose-1-phosphate thymidylyltransferase
MKGIILAGGSGTRLYPSTQTVSKQLLPVYDKPMIYYPLSLLMLFGIKEYLVISTPQDTPNIKGLLGDGKRLGISIQYAVQPEPKGIAQAFTIGADFIGKEPVTLILGDNIFYLGGQMKEFKQQMKVHEENNRAMIFAYHVTDPERFGVVEFNRDFKALSIEEKPKKPKSSYAAVGLYCFPGDVVEKARSLKPSARGELEITDLNNLYLSEGRMDAMPMRRGNAWLDAGTPDALLEAAQYVQIMEKRQGLKIACLEEIALRMGFIDEAQMQALADELKDSMDYKKYLLKILAEFREFN